MDETLWALMMVFLVAVLIGGAIDEWKDRRAKRRRGLPAAALPARKQSGRAA